MNSEQIKRRNDRQYLWQKENTDRINFTMPKGKKAQIKEIAEIKLPDLNAYTVEEAMKIVEGTALNMGIKVSE